MRRPRVMCILIVSSADADTLVSPCSNSPRQDKTYCRHLQLQPVYEKGLLLFRDHVVRASNMSGRLKQIMLENVRRYGGRTTRMVSRSNRGRAWTHVLLVCTRWLPSVQRAFR
jgi:hypothetical protein